MKKCEYCGTSTEDTAKSCPSCGATLFERAPNRSAYAPVTPPQSAPQLVKVNLTAQIVLGIINLMIFFPFGVLTLILCANINNKFTQQERIRAHAKVAKLNLIFLLIGIFIRLLVAMNNFRMIY